MTRVENQMTTNDNKPKNPWGSPQSGNDKPSVIKGGQSDLPDLDDILRKAREKFGGGGSSPQDGDYKLFIMGGLVLLVL